MYLEILNWRSAVGFYVFLRSSLWAGANHFSPPHGLRHPHSVVSLPVLVSEPVYKQAFQLINYYTLELLPTQSAHLLVYKLGNNETMRTGDALWKSSIAHPYTWPHTSKSLNLDVCSIHWTSFISISCKSQNTVLPEVASLFKMSMSQLKYL